MPVVTKIVGDSGCYLRLNVLECAEKSSLKIAYCRGSSYGRSPSLGEGIVLLESGSYGGNLLIGSDSIKESVSINRYYFEISPIRKMAREIYCAVSMSPNYKEYCFYKSFSPEDIKKDWRWSSFGELRIFSPELACYNNLEWIKAEVPPQSKTQRQLYNDFSGNRSNQWSVGFYNQDIPF